MFTVYSTTNILQKEYYKSFFHKEFIYMVKGGCN